jgi:hypothetical protein
MEVDLNEPFALREIGTKPILCVTTLPWARNQSKGL